MVVVEAPKSDAPASTEAGAIRDARLRQARRRRRVTIALGAIAAAGGLAAAFVGHLGTGSSPRRGVGARRVAFEPAIQRQRSEGWHISPALEGGEYGWCIQEANGGWCSTLPIETPGSALGHDETRHAVAIGAIAGTTGESHKMRATALLTSDVHAVIAYGHPTTLITHARLPYHLRLVQIDLPQDSTTDASGAGLLALGAHGKTLGAFGLEAAPAELVGTIRWWQKPQRGALGPCQIRAHGLPALEPEWGHVAATIEPYPGKIIGRAFFSCADSEYYLHNWPLETAILLDAQHPGSEPAPIPGMKAVPRAPGLFNAPGDWQGEITAVHRGRAWLVVAGGSGLAQRIAVLRHLGATIHL